MGRREKFSLERLERIRRLRKARRFFKQIPLFAFTQMVEEYPCYTYDEFLDDLRRRTHREKKEKKNGLIKYGRYERMQKLLALYDLTRELAYAIDAKNLRSRMTKPYQVRISVKNEYRDYSFSPLTSIESIEKLVSQLSGVKDKNQVDQIIEEFSKWDHVI